MTLCVNVLVVPVHKACSHARIHGHAHTYFRTFWLSRALSLVHAVFVHVCMLCVCALFVWLHVCVCVHCLLSFIRARRTIGNGIINVNFNRFITLLGKSYNRLLTSATWRFHLIGFRSLRNSIDIEDLRIKN